MKVVLLITTLLALTWETLARHNDMSYKDNFYILLSASKFYFNYRHTLNVLLIYQYLKEQGITDDQILLMLPTDHPCVAQNLFPGTIYGDGQGEHKKNWYCNDVQVDFKEEDLTADTILNAMRGRYDDFYPQSKRLMTNPNSRIFIFFNGHGGENFFKIQDTDLVHSEDFGKVLNEMHAKGLYKEILMILDTCEAASLFEHVEAPNLFMMASSDFDESAVADIPDGELNTMLSDKFTAFFSEFLHSPVGFKNEQSHGLANTKLSDFARMFSYDKIKSHVNWKTTSKRKLTEVYLSEYFPINGERDVLYGKGIDQKQDEAYFMNWSDLV